MAKSKTPAQRLDEMAPFLRTIAEYPDDDTPRLVFADWLDEHEYPDRAKFIRLQIELARMDPADDGYAEKTAAMRRCGIFTEPGELPFFDHLPTEKCRIGFRRGFIEAIDTEYDADRIDTSGFDLIPLLALRTGNKLIAQFKRFPKLKWFEYFNGYGRDSAPTPAQLLEVLGPQGWFKELEELSLPNLTAAHLAAGVIPQLDLPRLRNFYIETGEFSYLGVRAPRDDDEEGEDDYGYGQGYPWDGLPDYLPRNALPSPKTPLERFVWHGDDDSDLYDNDVGWEWRGPTMESVLSHLEKYPIKQVEMATDYDDHECGEEGIIAAPNPRNPLALSDTLEYVTLAVDSDDLQRLASSKRKLKGLRVYGEGEFDDALLRLLRQPVCSALESLHVENRGRWGTQQADGPNFTFPKLTSLFLAGVPSWLFSDCQFPNLISLRIDGQPGPFLERTWPRLQNLTVHVEGDTLADLKAFAASNHCPNLTTLTIDGYFMRVPEPDYSFLASCPHMPHLSLIRVGGYPHGPTCIVADGELIPIRSDVMMDDLTPTTPYRFSVAF